MGSGTGGINAILIGRLGMSISAIKKAYKGLKDNVFGHITAKTEKEPLFDSQRLEKWAKKIVKMYTGNEDSEMIPEGEGFGNINNRGCQM